MNEGEPLSRGEKSASVVAQAKINLFLRILAREASGYHQLETLFCRLALGDRVTVRTGGSGRSLDVAGPAVPPEGLGPVERNLAWRAAAAYAEAAGWPTGFAIEIEKEIPVGGGLGGGSADAGGVLRALNALAPVPLDQQSLLEIAGTLGADVPFLTQDGSALALAWGRGERLLAVAALPPRYCLLFVQPFAVSTVDAYGWLSQTPERPVAPIVYSADAFGTWAEVDERAYNAFERVVGSRHPQIGTLLQDLRDGQGRGGAVTLMSGSGATVFSLAGRESSRASGRSEGAGNESRSVRVVATSTAAHVEPVRLAD